MEDSIARYHWTSPVESAIDEIASNVNQFRNNLDHGNLAEQVDAQTINDLMVVERLVYAMRLKKLGLSDEVIRDGLARLF